MRTVLIHLNVEVPDTDPRTPEQLAAEILAAAAVDLHLQEVVITAPLAEVVG